MVSASRNRHRKLLQEREINMNRRNNNDNPGCLSGILQLFLVSKIYNWAQETFGAKHGGCCGCAIGAVLFIIMIMVVLRIFFNVDWTSISF